MTAQIDALVAQAEMAAGEGRWADAERLWGDVAKAAPDHGLALHRLGIHAFQRGAYLEAEAALARACTLIPQDPMVALMLANARRELGQIEGEFAALQLALSADAYFYPALLAKGALYERQGRLKLAAVTYRNVLKIAPPEAHWPPSLAPGLSRAAKIVHDSTTKRRLLLPCLRQSVEQGACLANGRKPSRLCRAKLSPIMRIATSFKYRACQPFHFLIPRTFPGCPALKHRPPR